MEKTLFLHGFKPLFGAFLKDVLFKAVLLLGNLSWVFLWSCIFGVFDFTFRRFLSSSMGSCAEFESDFSAICENPDEVTNEYENQEVGSDSSDEIGAEEELPKLNYEVKSVSNASTSKYQICSGTGFSSFVEEPKMMSFTVQEMFVISNDGSTNRQHFLEDHASPNNSDDISDIPCDDHDVVENPSSSESLDCSELNGREESVKKQSESESSISGLSFEEQEALTFTQLYFCEQGETVNEQNRDVQPVPNSDDFWAVLHKFDDFSDDDSGSDETPMGIDGETWDLHEDTPKSQDDILFDFNEQSEHHIEHDSTSDEMDCENELDKEIPATDDSNDFSPKDDYDGEDDDDDEQAELEHVLSEHKELIKQMKKEMRHLKSGGGLPVILEESESPRVVDDLRPLKIDGKTGHKQQLIEIQTIYKGYLDKMRKLDILSQQTMYTIRLLQLKNQDDFTWNRRISDPIMKSLSAQNFWSYNHRDHRPDSTHQIKDCLRDLELVYVGQLCLSWEILKWQHHKAGELQAYDTDGFHQHNQAARDFQQFQVLLQRFTQEEQEPLHNGPRVQHYVKHRCDLPSLLQVPLIKDDPRSEWRGNREGPISISVLKEIIWASMHTFWEFIRADKDETCSKTETGTHSAQFDLQDPLDTELLAEIQSNLRKKEKRLKDIGRSGNFIVKKFQKQQDERPSHDMLLALVELRLITRVLHMPRLTTNQLLWCHKKLGKINVVGRKVYIDSSFLLFPC